MTPDLDRSAMPQGSDALWSYFAGICAIPHPSRGEEGLARWIADEATRLGLPFNRDGVGNIIVMKGATPGMERRRGMILQSHLDMVCQSLADSGKDPARDGVRLRQMPEFPGWLSADGTTLGADDGIGVAASMAIMAARDLPHGPLEFVFTVNEEDGMDGVKGLDLDSLGGSVLVNLDGEEEEEICISCAGASRSVLRGRLAVEPCPPGTVFLEARVSGLRGGHSGGDIHLGRGNAIRILVQLLARDRSDGDMRLVSLDAGTASNAIPRSATCVLGIPALLVSDFKRGFEKRAARVGGELGQADPGFMATLSDIELPSGVEAASAKDGRALMLLLLGLPCGPLEYQGLAGAPVKTSCSLGIVKGSAEGPGSFDWEIVALARSSSEDSLERVALEISAAALAIGASCERPAESPAWAARPHSPFLARAQDAYRASMGREPRITGTHGGLECAFFAKRRPDLEMICIGPNIRHPHSPDERVEIASVGRFWNFLRALLKEA